MRVLTLTDIARMKRVAAEEAMRERAQAVPVSDGLILARVLGRYKMLLSAADRGFACNVMLDGYWESWLTRFLAGRLKAGMHVADIGANFGYYTLLMAAAVGPAGRVHAIEPHPETAHVLRQNVVLNGFDRYTEVHELALGAEISGEVTLFTPDGEPKNATVVATAPPHGGRAVTVRATSFDELLGDQRLDLVKIDAEGAEVGILAGMARLIERHRPAMVLEFNAARYGDPAAVLGSLLRIYGRAKVISHEGYAEPIAPETVLSTQIGEDWLLYFE